MGDLGYFHRVGAVGAGAVGEDHFGQMGCGQVKESERSARDQDVSAAEGYLNAWSDADQFHGVITDESLIPAVADLQSVFGVHDAMLASAQLPRLGGHGGDKLGWKNSQHLKGEGLPGFYCPIFKATFFSSEDEVDLSWWQIFAAEAEFGFHLQAPFEPRDKPYTEEEVWAGVCHIELCIELIGSRVAHALDDTMSPWQHMADVAFNAGVVRGPSMPKEEVDVSHLVDIPVSLSLNEKLVSTGSPKENPLDSPLGSLTFMVNDMAHRSQKRVEPGLVICGHCCQMAFCGHAGYNCTSSSDWSAGQNTATVKHGDTLTAQFGDMGATSLKICESANPEDHKYETKRSAPKKPHCAV